MTNNYYVNNLNASKLIAIYQTEIPQVKKYLASEINFVARKLTGQENLLELGAGYGRIMRELAPFARSITGIDVSKDFLDYGQSYLKDYPSCRLKLMDAHNLEFDSEFDLVICLQNGLSALKGEPLQLVREALKVLKPGGKAYFSGYSPKFWDYRLAWFKEQADRGLLGELDLEKSKDGKIFCKDGFSATTHSYDELEKIGRSAGHWHTIKEVDDSSLFLIIEK